MKQMRFHIVLFAAAVILGSGVYMVAPVPVVAGDGPPAPECPCVSSSQCVNPAPPAADCPPGWCAWKIYTAEHFLEICDKSCGYWWNCVEYCN